MHERISASASAYLNDLLGSLARRQEQRAAVADRQYAINEALVRLLPEKERAGLLGAQQPDRQEMIGRFAEAESAARQRLQDGSGAARRTADMMSALQIQVLAPPYADTWRWTGGLSGDGTVANTNADRDAGSFGFTLATGHGHAAAAAGVWAQFIPDGPAPIRMIATRPYVRFADQWDSNTLGQPYGAHNEGGFGMSVLSWNLEGQDQQQEPLFPWMYYNWSKDTGWFSEDHDNNWPGADEGLSYTFSGNTPPAFIAFTHRIYRIAVYCFGECDAGGGFFGQGITASWIGARADFIIVQEI